MKKFNVFICGLIFALIVSTVSPSFVQANELASKESALAESVLYNFNTKS